MDHLTIWNRFCDRFEISTSCIPLFELTDSGHVLTKEIGSKVKRLVLRRSQGLELRLRLGDLGLGLLLVLGLEFG